MRNGRSLAPGADGTDEWLSLLDQYRVEVAVLSAPTDSHRIQLMCSKGAWEVRRREGDTVLLCRAPGGDGPRLQV